MGNQNSLEFYIELLCSLRSDIALPNCHTSTERDCVEIRNRVRNEGIGFLTKTLPTLAKAVDKSLAQGAPLDTAHFRVRRNRPIFMGEFFELVFDDDGRERVDSDPLAVRAIRQISLYYYKLNVPNDTESENRVIRGFVDVEAELSSAAPIDQRSAVITRGRVLVSRIFSEVDSDDAWRDITPRHGPGSVSTREKHEGKYLQAHYTQDLQEVYPFEEYFVTGLSHVADSYHRWADLQFHDTGTAKVVLVPKDSRGPRLISCEPVDKQWIQQGIMDLMVKTIERHPTTRGKVNFTDQTVNRNLALESSRTGRYVTLDMKDASDRVSLDLVKALFGGTRLLRCLLASRSGQTQLPDGTLVPLAKFAPMGSACCFPVEALCFWSLAVAIIQLTKGLPVWVIPEVYVYGDDIIVRTEDYQYVYDTLPKFHLRWNKDKCCTHGSFRESCGMDAHKGVQVTPLRFRKVVMSKQDPSQYISLLTLCNAHRIAGHHQASEFLEKEIRAIYRRPIPYTSDEMQGYGFYRERPSEVKKLNKRLQRRLSSHGYVAFKTYIPVAKRIETLSAGWEAGLKTIVSKKYTDVQLRHSSTDLATILDTTPVELLRLRWGWHEFRDL